MNSEMINVLIELKNQGVEIHLTEEGWKELIRLMEERNQTSKVNEVI
ncbi:hypothetical protein [Paenibacillus xylaniclasticus]|nr:MULTISPECIES: hypothetical protein [Paenibacillus]GFN32571.1 hypothetical protein PCURB6_28310 [Paenibacillus curdlanolyticus]